MQILIDTGDSKLWVYENYSPDLFPYLQQLPLAFEPPIMVWGEMKQQRRNVAFFSDESKGYKYSGQFMPSTPFSIAPLLKDFLNEVNVSLNTKFNGILVNQYTDGTKVVGAHPDAEENLDKTGRKMVACISYGTTRTFRIRDKVTKKIVLDYPHKPLTLLVMEGEFQSLYTHEIPPELKIKEERISMTFRHHLI